MTPRQFLERYPTLLKKHGSQRKVARSLGIPRSTIYEWLAHKERHLYTEQGPDDAVVYGVPKRDVLRFIFTSAQDGTSVHVPFLRNLEAYASHLGAALIIGGFTYNKRLFEEHRKNALSTQYAPEVRKYMVHQRMDIGNNLMFCGEMNTLPTAVMPLTGFETYTREKWGIFPHAKVQLVSVPTMKHTPAKQIMTTGAVTMPNYVQKRAGIRAHFHHVFGAVLVEIDSAGDHFCRHLLGDKDDGSFQDLTRIVKDGCVTDGFSIEAVNWGDIHVESLNEVVANATVNMNGLSPDNMLDVLRPRVQLFHDTSDFKRRNHHNLKDPHFRFRMFINGTESVDDELEAVAAYLVSASRPWCKSVVVESNHDLALLRWLKEVDWREDPINAEFYLQAQLVCLRAIRECDKRFSVLEWALKHFYNLESIRFLREEESYRVKDIECGMHGHLGSNGSKGSPKQFTKMGPKSNTGHVHSPAILDGAYVAGTCSNLDMEYNKGLSSWAHAHIVTYPSGKRTIVTMSNGKWRAA